jgi:colanic acid/amylovoran biosynthesis glycosyltransferase
MTTSIFQLPPLKPSLFIYRNSLLPSSETFILAQGESLSDFRSIYVGLRRVPGLEMPQDRCVLLAAGRFPRLKSAQLKLSRASASDVTRLRAFRPNLVHAHFGMDAVNAMTLAKALDIPLVATFHGWDATVRDEILRCQSIALNLYIKRRPRLGRFASRVLCVSEFIRQQVLKKGFPPDKTIVHYTGIDLTKFVPDLSLRREPIVLFVGRLVEKKGCEYLIRAMQVVQSNVKEAKLVVIGDGVLRKSLELQAQATLRSCRFLGGCSAEVIRQWMNRASVFSTPSIVADSGDAEGFGMVFAEAQAMGLPVASFATGGVPEAVEHGVTGLLAPERDTNALANNIVRLLTDNSMWRRFSAAGQERVKKLFNLEKQTPKLEQVYCEVLQEHRTSVTAA